MKKRTLNLILFISIFIIQCNTNNHKYRSFTFIYEVEIEPTNKNKMEMWIPLPQSNEVQEITNLNIDSEDLNFLKKKESIHGNDYLYVYSDEGIIKKSKILIEFDVKRYEHKNVIYENVNHEKYLSSYMTVPTGNIFNSIIKKNNLTKDNVEEIYNFVLNGMHYGKPKSVDNEYYNDPWLSKDGEYGIRKVDRDVVVSMYQTAKKEDGNFTFGHGNSLYACNIGVGNCTDYHSYFMSLGRTMEIPVRFHMGFPIPNASEGRVGGYHCWADYYIDGEGWYPVDISEADKDPKKSEYYFGTACENRVEMVVGRDFILENYDHGPVNIFIYPLLEVADQKSSAFSKSFRYKEINI